MIQTIAQIKNDMEIARMRLDQSRAKLCEAIMAGDATGEARLDMVYASAISDYMNLKNCHDKMVCRSD